MGFFNNFGSSLKEGEDGVVARVGVRKKEGYEYYVDENGDISVKNKAGISQKVAKVGIKREKGFFYYIDDNGHISRKKVGVKEEDEEKKEVRNNLYKCASCGYIWKTRNKHSGSYKCPRCKSKSIIEAKVD